MAGSRWTDEQWEECFPGARKFANNLKRTLRRIKEFRGDPEEYVQLYSREEATALGLRRAHVVTCYVGTLLGSMLEYEEEQYYIDVPDGVTVDAADYGVTSIYPDPDD